MDLRSAASRVVRRALGRRSGAADDERGREHPVDWYDGVFADPHTDYRHHYTRSRYYFLWTVIADRIPESASVLEIGCGPGQLAHYLRDCGLKRYLGFDFSPQAIQLARERVPEFDFRIEDAFTTELLGSHRYDHVICTEFLEHVEGDLEVLRRVRLGARCLLTVPNFPYLSHVRHFRDSAEVLARYGSLFSDPRCTEFPSDADGQRFFLIDGHRA